MEDAIQTAKMTTQEESDLPSSMNGGRTGTSAGIAVLNAASNSQALISFNNLAEE